ncbi:Uma2 family endonuclease [Tsukamurella paurometabola]|uniref:Uma2 family endonuclease n=1 Tax=Tsukamurella paurometabola TaxID=2061 RepID=A0ABS5NHG8_TSUPA|nr:Uma2 family endonuclease [Tsukamurella paurometabola]MBS4103704.1 Uma2 family endonuclease [Tsukamurella paurometabola]
MTAATRPHLLSLEEWRALGEDTASRAELQEGVLIVSPRPSSKHSLALSRLWAVLDAAAPKVLAVREEVDVVLDPRTPATVRVPDVVVLREGAQEPYSAADVLLAVEVLSPGTRRVDLVMKRSEYADADIPHYWIVDLDASTLEALVLSGGGYESVVATGTYAASEPFPVTVDLAHLA